MSTSRFFAVAIGLVSMAAAALAAPVGTGFTYQGHPPALAAGLAVQRYLEEHNLLERVRERGAYVARRLEPLREHPAVGDVRGLGLLQTVEFVADRATRAPFPPEKKFADQLFEMLRARGIMAYPVRGTVDGVRGDHVLLAPPFVIEESQIDFLVDELESAVTQVADKLAQPK